MRFFYLFLVVLVTACTTRQRLPLSPQVLYEKMKAASLILLVNNKENGSAAFVSGDGYIVSAAHCLTYRDDKLEVVSPVFGRLPVELVALDKGHDMMLLKAELGSKKTVCLTPALTMPNVTERIYQFGAPIYRHGVVQTGTIARQGAYFEYYAEHHDHYIEVIHVAAPIQGGTSGGPWVNQYGDYIGLQSGTLLVGNSPCGVAFMSPVTKFASVIKWKRSAVSRNLNFRVMHLASQESKTISRYNGHRDGLVVVNIKDKSSAASSGLRQWDLIVAINGQFVKSRNDALELVRKSRGDKLKLTILSIDQKKSKILEIPVDIVEDRIVFRKGPKKISAK